MEIKYTLGKKRDDKPVVLRKPKDLSGKLLIGTIKQAVLKPGTGLDIWTKEEREIEREKNILFEARLFELEAILSLINDPEKQDYIILVALAEFDPDDIECKKLIEQYQSRFGYFKLPSDKQAIKQYKRHKKEIKKNEKSTKSHKKRI
jgi:hypothetical protein